MELLIERNLDWKERAMALERALREIAALPFYGGDAAACLQGIARKALGEGK